MYDELVNELRDGDAFEICGTYDILGRAADAIAELSRENESLAKRVNEASEILRKRWIPVTERLPKKDGTFITAYSKGGVSQNWYMIFHHGGGKWYQIQKIRGKSPIGCRSRSYQRRKKNEA